MEGWKTVKYSNTQETGPAHAMEALVKELEAQGTEYTVEDYGFKSVRKTRKTVGQVELEVRNASDNKGSNK